MDYISPTSLMLFNQDREEFYRKYISPYSKVYRKLSKQTQPMAVGSAFDAFAKSYLHKELYGPGYPEYVFKTIFTSQVDEEHREWALGAGKGVFIDYIKSGALADLMLALKLAFDAPRFEFTVEGEVDGVPILGKPDAFFSLDSGELVILDWKVNGYCSNYSVSPKPGYVMLRPGDKSHKDCVNGEVGGLIINTNKNLEDVDEKWATQIQMYAWALGGGSTIACIDQLVFDKHRKLRVAEHRSRIGTDFATTLRGQLVEAWDAITNDRVVTKEKADEINTQLERAEKDVNEAWYLQHIEGGRPFYA